MKTFIETEEYLKNKDYYDNYGICINCKNFMPEDAECVESISIWNHGNIVFTAKCTKFIKDEYLQGHRLPDNFIDWDMPNINTDFLLEKEN